MDVLLGTLLDGVNRVMWGENLQFTDNLPTVGVPAQLLLNRPDLRAAQAELVAADADIGAVIANRLPKITLGGSYGLTDSASFTGVTGPSLWAALYNPCWIGSSAKQKLIATAHCTKSSWRVTPNYSLKRWKTLKNALIVEQKQREFLIKLGAQQAILQQTVEIAEALS